ncbi:MAG: DUF924 domain-containing protein [Pseudobacteriovorax sp.]|nr:DUF924 domain-containing protein [Pseudobacteriovorax sp.]
MHWNHVIKFWFEDIDRSFWFKKDKAFDEEVRSRFGDVIEAALRCELYKWRDEPQGRVAEIIVLDQFTRNAFRDTNKAFSGDQLALCLSQTAHQLKIYENLEEAAVAFLYMPYMHSESREIHVTALEIYQTNPSLQRTLEYEIKHKKIIDRFGRYPHRNAILGRQSSEEEILFLKEPGSSF